MIRQEQHDNSINVLVKAYFEEILQHGNDCGCAVGNLIMDACGYTYRFNEYNRLVWVEQEPYWYTPKCHFVEGLDQRAKTGYSTIEVDEIEEAFESVYTVTEKDKDGFLGLMAVVDALAVIHECTPGEKETAKQRFKEPALA